LAADGEDRLQLLDEIPHVLELAIHAREPHVGHLVERLQQFHEPLAQHTAGQLAFVGPVQLGFEGRHDGLDVLLRHRPLPAGLRQATLDLVPVEGLTHAPFFHDRQQLPLDALVGREPPAAGEALTATADRATLVDWARVDDPAIGLAAIGTVHWHPLTTSQMVMKTRYLLVTHSDSYSDVLYESQNRAALGIRLWRTWGVVGTTCGLTTPVLLLHLVGTVEEWSRVRKCYFGVSQNYFVELRTDRNEQLCPALKLR